MLLDVAALELLGRQFFVATTQQLVDHGVPRRTLVRARESGQLLDAAPGVVRLAGAADSFECRAMALLLQMGPHGILADVTSARIWGIPRLPQAKVTITVPWSKRPTAPHWARVIRSRWIDEWPVARSDGLVVTSPERTLFDLGAHFHPKRFEHAAENLWNRDLITPDSAARYLSAIRRQGRRGVSRLEAWLEDVQVRPRRASQSGLEVDFAQALGAAGLPPPLRQFPLQVNDGRVLIHVDLAWPNKRLGLEPGHSVFHAGRDAVRRDIERDRWCDEVGWRILRFDEVELRDMVTCVAQTVRIYRSRPTHTL